jgi:hypothetical protein
MGTVLSIADLIVLLMIVWAVVRAVWKGSGSLLLSAGIAVILVLFALVSLAAQSGLAQGSSSLTQIGLFAFLVVTAILLRVSWVGKSIE